MIEILKKGIVPVIKYIGTCMNCGTVARCDHSDLDPSSLLTKHLKCPVCGSIIQVSMTSSYSHGFPFPSPGPAVAGPAKEPLQFNRTSDRKVL